MDESIDHTFSADQEKGGILNRMDTHLSSWREKGDRRQVFLSCYRLMTGNMLLALEQGQFKDPDWVSELLHHFADYYFEALECYDCGREGTRVWNEVHAVTRERKLHRLQCLLLGINAHINYDLVLALYDMLAPEWPTLDEAGRRSRFEDHCMVNSIIAQTIDRVQDEILEDNDLLMAIVDRAFGRLDEYLISRLIRHWRSEVWEGAESLLRENEPKAREAIRQDLERKVLRLGDILA